MADETATKATPLTRKGQETRRRIVEAAADLLYERTVATVSLEDVCQATSTSKSQLYHYFDDKNDLVQAVIDYERERVLGFHRPQLESLSSWDDLQRWRDMIVEVQADRSCRGGCPLGSLASELADLDEPARRRLSDAFRAWERLLTEGLADMVETGALRADANTTDLAVSVIASLQGGLLLAEIDRSTRPLEIALDAAIAHVRSFASDAGKKND
jgi:TetR/AcrR family transcriptional regulator, transcriptional repressor for nem operon